MNPAKIVAILLIVFGGLGLMYGGFSYTKVEDKAHIGNVHVEKQETEHVNIPLWAGLGALVVGIALLAAPRRT